ncbi:MAG: FlgD immunoglobulin-like domain containing protein, partial [Treponema sp.]|nr:FlgD immunoglobulin-like domain containing protein [Treponema sp.]
GGAESSIFVAPENSKSTGIEDGCYFKVPLTDASGHDPKSEFQIYFDAEDSSVYVTDLAGNLLKKELYTLNTVDRSSPSVNVTAAPCGKDEMYIVFSKAINIDEIIGHTKDNKDEVKLNALECIPKALTISGAPDLKIDDSVPARVVHRTENATGFILKLTRPITIDDIKGGFYIEVKESAEYPYDSLSGINAKVTLVQDMAGNYADAGKQHALTDFAINVIEPEFAHNSNMLDSNGDDVQFGLYSEGSWAVHSWGRDQGNYGTLNPEYDVFMRVQDPYDLLAGKTDTLFLSNNPTDNSVSYEYNRISGRNWRIWLPEISANISPVANNNVITLDGNADGTDPHIINYDIKLLSESATYDGYDAGTTITFLFDTGLFVKHDGSSGIGSPLYALRLSDPNDVSSLDLWSIKLKSITAQRGGVSILNNVINPLDGEKAVLRLNMASAGSVNIMVMTLDGNIVTYLNRGEVESGEQFFTWDGKNTSGKVVARGMYFIRVMGNGIDETRKVMIVK